LPKPAGLRIDGQTRMDWQERYLLIIDEVGMLGARTLYAVNEQALFVCPGRIAPQLMIALLMRYLLA
jgi:hypothetical protein